MSIGRVDRYKLPNSNTYWVKPGRFLAGEYPGHQRSEQAQARLRDYLAAGVTFFLDLTVPGELRSYERFLYETSEAMGVNPFYQRLPIVDASVPRAAEYMSQILNVIDHALADRHVVYVHCWGGIGRTGLVVGCYFVRHGMKGEQALKELARLWKTVEKSAWHPESPETPQQREFILNWREPGRARRG